MRFTQTCWFRRTSCNLKKHIYVGLDISVDRDFWSFSTWASVVYDIVRGEGRRTLVRFVSGWQLMLRPIKLLVTTPLTSSSNPLHHSTTRIMISSMKTWFFADIMQTNSFFSMVVFEVGLTLEVTTSCRTDPLELPFHWRFRQTPQQCTCSTKSFTFCHLEHNCTTQSCTKIQKWPIPLK